MRLMLILVLMAFSMPAYSAYYGLQCYEYAEKENKKAPHTFFNARLLKGRCDYKTEAMHYTMQMKIGKLDRKAQENAIKKFMEEFKPLICRPQHNTWNLVDRIIFEFYDENERFAYSYQINRQECVL